MPVDRVLTAKGQATRDRIVEAAVGLIGLHGVAGVSTEQVRRAAGVSGSQLYHYFDSKQALVRAVITRQADLATGSDASPGVGALDSFEALDAWADAAIARRQELLDGEGLGDCTLGSLAGELAAVDEQSRVEISQGFLRWLDVLRTGLTGLQDRGELQPDADVDDLAFALLAALQGGSLMSQTLRDVAPMRAAMGAVLAYVRASAVRSASG